MALPTYLTIPETGRVLGISRFRVMRFVEDGRLQMHQLPGKKWPRVKGVDVAALIVNTRPVQPFVLANDLGLHL